MYLILNPISVISTKSHNGRFSVMGSSIDNHQPLQLLKTRRPSAAAEAWLVWGAQGWEGRVRGQSPRHPVWFGVRGVRICGRRWGCAVPTGGFGVFVGAGFVGVGG